MDMIVARYPPDVLAQVRQGVAASSNPGVLFRRALKTGSRILGRQEWRTLMGLLRWAGPAATQHGAKLSYVLGRAGEAKWPIDALERPCGKPG